MARHDVIDSYLAGLRGRLTWRRDADDVIDELRDHLYSAVDDAGGRTGGPDPDSVAQQQQALDRLGDQDRLVVSLAMTPRGGIAVPTPSSRMAGTLALVTAALWLVFPFGWLLTGLYEDGTDLEWAGRLTWIAGTLCLIGGAGLTVAVMAGVRERLGGLGLLATVGMVFVGLGALAGVFAWFVMLWASLVAIGALLIAIAVAREDVAPRLPIYLLGSAWVIGIATWALLRALEVGSPDEWGDYWLANILGVSTGTVLFALALVLLGRWLRSEEPVKIDVVEPILPA